MPSRTVSPDGPASRVVAFSSSDLDAVVALGVDPVAAWAPEGTGPRPWRRGPAPPVPEWAGTGLPTLASLLPYASDGLLLTGADPADSQVRAYEQIAPVVLAEGVRSDWRRQLALVAEAMGSNPDGPRTTAERALTRWSRGQRDLGVRGIAVVLATGVSDDTLVATLARDQPFAREIAALGFEVVAGDGPVPYRDLRRKGVQVVRVDPRDGDRMCALRQPSVTSLPWLLEGIVAGRRPA